MKESSASQNSLFSTPAHELAAVQAASSYFRSAGADVATLPNSFFWTELVQHVMAAQMQVEKREHPSIQFAQYRVVIEIRNCVPSAYTNVPGLQLLNYDAEELSNAGVPDAEIAALRDGLDETLLLNTFLDQEDMFKQSLQDCEARSKPAPEAARIVLVMEGGAVQEIYTSQPTIEVVVYDWDNAHVTPAHAEKLSGMLYGCSPVRIIPCSGQEEDAEDQPPTHRP